MQNACSNQTMPVLNLEEYSGWGKGCAALKFLPVAFNFIASHKLRPICTFHIYNKDEIAIGISDGYIYYPTDLKMMDDLAKLITYIEDRRFYTHHGVDLKGITRAFVRNIRALKIVEGGSTITQQLIRNSLLTNSRTVLRKVLEVILALKVEKHYSKEEILNLYAQFVYLGNGIRGFSAAAKVIYRRSLQAVTHEEVCGLLGLIRKPSTTFPNRSSFIFKKRQQFIAKHIRDDKSLANLSDNSLSIDLNPIDLSKFKKPRWSAVIEKSIEKSFGDARNNMRRVGITIDSTVQNILDDALRQTSLQDNVSQIAAVVLDNETCDILGEAAWSGGKETSFSPTFAGKIQPGSTFKTFAYLTALELGLTSELKLMSGPFKSYFIKDGNSQPWSVRNYGEIYRGELTLRDALKYSDNTVFARLAELIDCRHFFSTFNRYRLCRGNEVTPSVVLGASIEGTSLLSLVSAYAAIARNGIYRYPRFIRYFEDYNGRFSWTPSASKGYIASDNYWAIAEVRKALAEIGSQICNAGFSGKTGTTKKGSLLAGYNDNISLAIWTGFRVQPSESDAKAMSSRKVLLRIIESALGYQSKLFSI